MTPITQKNDICPYTHIQSDTVYGVHNTSPRTVTVRRTLIIYLLQFCLFSSIFHISSPHVPPPPTAERPQKKNVVRVCIGTLLCIVVTTRPAPRGHRLAAARLPNFRTQKTRQIMSADPENAVIKTQFECN